MRIWCMVSNFFIRIRKHEKIIRCQGAVPVAAVSVLGISLLNRWARW